MPGASRAPTASYAKVESIRVSHRRHTGSDPAFPARRCCGLFRALPGDRPFCHRRQRDCRSNRRRFDASIGAPGPHDFAVRDQRARLPRETSAIASRAQRP